MGGFSRKYIDLLDCNQTVANAPSFTCGAVDDGNRPSANFFMYVVVLSEDVLYLSDKLHIC